MLITIILIGVALVGFAYFLLAYDNGYSGFQHMAAPPRSPEERPEGSFSTVYFPAVDGAKLEGWLFRPKEAPAPLVIMAPGLTGTKEGHLEPFAWRFVREGLAVLVIDFRCFGGSEGEPRHWVDPFRQGEDYKAAIQFATDALATDGIIDPSRIALWGSSFSGGTALMTAADLPAIAAVVAQCPFLDTPKELEPTRPAMVRYFAWTLLDLVRSRLQQSSGLRLAPVYIPTFGQIGEFAFATSRENPSRFDPAQRGVEFWTTMPASLRGGWENKLLARFLADFDKFKPKTRLSSVKCPVYLVAAAADDMVPQRFVEEAHEIVRHNGGELTVHDCGHFGLYVEPVLGRNADLQATFLARHLRRQERELAAQHGGAIDGITQRN